jgi:hypothetical protein
VLYLYDSAITDDLIKSFNPTDDGAKPVVKVVGPDQVVGLAAQIQEDKISFPIVAITRNDYQIDEQRMNFTRAHFGVATVLDKKTNNLYYEKALPIKLSYNLTLLTTNQADMDELVRETLFKYLQMYYLTIKLPYEADRKIRFGLAVDDRTDIQRTSGSVEYLENGTLYQSIITLNCEGCVLVTYTPAHLMRHTLSKDIEVE